MCWPLWGGLGWHRSRCPCLIPDFLNHETQTLSPESAGSQAAREVGRRAPAQSAADVWTCLGGRQGWRGVAPQGLGLSA